MAEALRSGSVVVFGQMSVGYLPSVRLRVNRAVACAVMKPMTMTTTMTMSRSKGARRTG